MEKGNAYRYICRSIGGDRGCSYVIMECLDAFYYRLVAINYWEAAGLMILAHLLLGGFGHHFMSFPWHMMREHDRFHERMDRMSWDEKREFIRKRMSRFNQEEE